MVAKIQGWHYRVEEVQQLNTSGNEWAISFNKSTPYLTISDGDKNSVLVCKALNFNKILPQKTFQNPAFGSYGFPVFRKNKVYYSYVEDKSKRTINEFFDSTGRVLVPIEEQIGQAELYSSDFKINEISNPERIDIYDRQVSDWYSQPAFTSDGHIMFFASDRKGSLGGVDIWMAYINNGKMSKPINCGNLVNTECDEITPFVSENDKKLYFASCGGETLGGFDIFSVEISDLLNESRLASTEELEKLNFFTKRENIRGPFNTKYNEISPFAVGVNDSLFYYASNQNQVSTSTDKGGFDIFVRYKVYIDNKQEKVNITQNEINIQPKEEVKIETPKTDWFYKLEGTVYEKKNNNPIDNAEIIAEEKIGTKKNSVKTDKQGNYSIPMIRNEEYLVTATARDLFPQNVKIFVGMDDTTKIVHQNFYLPEIYTLRVNFPTDVYDQPYRYVLDSTGTESNVLWQEDISSLAENIIQGKDNIVKIILVGHTDDVASDEYNQKLGERRVNFVKNELIKQGVPSELLEVRSAGESELLPRWPNESVEMNRKRCRRVVLEKVLK
ncbi:MAG: hypothetical protein A2X64_10560 [Ignavibacteria bacterium GWF2_33_9]|nr:MAG: hypothetical protein A2X64_10560 [Ignavibacteria bacterium GWF2_33_9]